MECLSSIVFHTVIMKMLSKRSKIKICGFISIYRTKLEYLSTIVYHTAILKCFQRRKNQEMWLRFYKEYKIEISIIDSFSHCHTENDLKRCKNQEMWLRFYIEDKL